MFEPSKLFEVVGEPILPLVVKKADPFSLESLIAWLETQPANREYDWPNIRGCLACIYLAEACEIRSVTDQITAGITLSDVFPSIAVYHAVGAVAPWTMGAALTRAQAALERLPRSFLQAEGGK